MHVNWIHKQRGIIRSNQRNFTIGEKENHTVYFWFKLTKKGPMKSALTNQDFYEDNFGEWFVEGSLNNEVVISNEFTIYN